MTAATMNAVASKLSRAARAKGSKDRDSRKDERVAFGRQIRRAGKVTVAEGLDALDDDQDDADELRNAEECAEAAEFSEADMAALVAAAGAVVIVF